MRKTQRSIAGFILGIISTSGCLTSVCGPVRGVFASQDHPYVEPNVDKTRLIVCLRPASSPNRELLNRKMSAMGITKGEFSLDPLFDSRVFLFRSTRLSLKQAAVVLRADPAVLYIEPDRRFEVRARLGQTDHGAPTATPQSSGDKWYSQMEDFLALGGPNLQPIYARHPPGAGSPVVVVNLDSGTDLTDPRVAGHHQLAQGVGVNWTADQATFDQDVQDPGLNRFSHGLAVEGQEIKAIDDDPGVQFWMERILVPSSGGNFSFVGQTSWVIEALQDVRNRMADPTFRVAAINLSLVGFQSLTVRDMLAAIPAPIFVAAGNGPNENFVGADLATEPDANAIGAYAAMLPNCSPIGALQQTGDDPTDFSNFGRDVRLWSPGVVQSLELESQVGFVEGTSFAAPSLAGTAAELALRLGITDPRQLIQQIAESNPLGAHGIILCHYDLPLMQDLIPAAAGDTLTLDGKVKYHTVRQVLTFQVSLSQPADGQLKHDYVVVPGCDAPDGSGTYFGALDLSAGGSSFQSLPMPDPGKEIQIMSKGGGVAVPITPPKVKHPND